MENKMSSNTLPIPDQSHLNKVRDALWSRPSAGASVMIGSGFSRNADKPRSEVDDLPLWSDVAAAIASGPYPRGSNYSAGFLRGLPRRRPSDTQK